MYCCTTPALVVQTGHRSLGGGWHWLVLVCVLLVSDFLFGTAWVRSFRFEKISTDNASSSAWTRACQTNEYP